MKSSNVSKKKIREFRFQSIIEIIMILLLVLLFVPVFVMLIMSFESVK